MADRDDVAANRADLGGIDNLRDTSDPRGVLLPMDDQAGEQERRHWFQVGAVRRHTLAAHVSQALPHLPGDAVTLEAIHRRFVAQYRRLESHQLQHQIRP